ncbi:MAG TPA: hypothetical protein VGR13_03435 [Actinomycetota bacterium]|nr:hypothetical protein [Actinomycetota bacterium]
MEMDSTTDPGSAQGSQGTGDAPPAGESKEAQLMRENAELRGKLRETEAKRLGAVYNLSDPIVDLLKNVDRDKQEDQAKAISDSLPKTPAGQAPPEPPPSEPPNAEALRQMQDQPPAAAPSATVTKEQELLRQIDQAPSWQALTGLQQQLEAVRRESGSAG